MNLCACDNEESDRGVGAGVNDTMLFGILQVVGLAEAARTAIRLRKKPMNLSCLLWIDKACVHAIASVYYVYGPFVVYFQQYKKKGEGQRE